MNLVTKLVHAHDWSSQQDTCCASTEVMLADTESSSCSLCMQVCKFYVQGRCLAGDRCRYAHPASAASRVELNQLGGRNVSQQVSANCACHGTLTVQPLLLGSWR